MLRSVQLVFRTHGGPDFGVAPKKDRPSTGGSFDRAIKCDTKTGHRSLIFNATLTSQVIPNRFRLNLYQDTHAVSVRISCASCM